MSRGLPKKFSRVTKHAKPKYQLYQPGFNAMNSCWLEGGWITLTRAEWTKRRAAHEKLYVLAMKAMREVQNYRAKPTPLKKMTPAQRQAWAYYQGDFILEGKQKTAMGEIVIGCRVKCGGTAPMEQDLKWLRSKGWIFPRWVKAGAKGKPTDQFRGLKMPKDLVEENTRETAFDHVSGVVKQNRARSEDLFEASLRALDPEKAKEAPGGEIAGMNFTQFSAMMAFHHLIEQEESIIREEWNISIGEVDRMIPYDAEKERALYVQIRAKLKVIDNFDQWYEQSRATHNECARTNLDNSEGRLYCYVLPKFNDDGTHEPWGERDVPWGNAPKKPAPAEATA